MDMRIGEEWSRYKRIWVILALVTPFLPATVSVFPILVNSIVAARSRAAFVAILAVNFLLNMALLMPLLSSAKRLRALGEAAQTGLTPKKDSGIYQVTSVVIAAWVVLMTLLGIVGWFFVG